MRGQYAKIVESEAIKQTHLDIGKIVPQYKGYQLTENQIREAMKNTRSNKEAARWLDIQYLTYKKYAKRYIDVETNKDLFELHKNQSGRGMPKNNPQTSMAIAKKGLDNQLKDGQFATRERVSMLKEYLIIDGRLGFKCSCCGYSEKRLTDLKPPFLLNFINGKKSDWRIENLRWLCYNCAFLIGPLDYINTSFMKEVESIDVSSATSNDVEKLKRFYELNDVMTKHLEEIGIRNNVSTPVNEQVKEEPKNDNDYEEFISYL
jgi:hypothetical protein